MEIEENGREFFRAGVVSEFQAADCVKLGGRVTGSHKSLWKLFQKCCAVECVLGGGPLPVSGLRLSVLSEPSICCSLGSSFLLSVF